jgi:hypothetical protein
MNPLFISKIKDVATSKNAKLKSKMKKILQAKIK